MTQLSGEGEGKTDNNEKSMVVRNRKFTGDAPPLKFFDEKFTPVT